MTRLDELLAGKEASPGHDTMSGSDAAPSNTFALRSTTVKPLPRKAIALKQCASYNGRRNRCTKGCEIISVRARYSGAIA